MAIAPGWPQRQNCGRTQDAMSRARIAALPLALALAPRTAFRRARLAWALSVALVACTDFLGPGRVTIRRPTLGSLVVSGLSGDSLTGGFVTIGGYPADTAFRLSAHERVAVDISVTSGDREKVGLYRRFCPARDVGTPFSCFQFIIGMQSGSDVRSLASAIEAMGGRFSFPPLSGIFGSITLLSVHNDLVSRVRAVRAWPSVAYTELVFPFCAPDSPGCLHLSDLMLPVAVDTGTVVPGDGTIEARSGDTIVVRYQQPTGAMLEARRVVP